MYGQHPKSGGKTKGAKESTTYQTPPGDQQTTQPTREQEHKIYDAELGLDPNKKETNYTLAQDRLNKMKQLETEFVNCLTDDEKIKYKEHIKYIEQPQGPESIIESDKIQEKVPEPVFALDLVKHSKRDEIGKYVSEIEKYKQEFDEYVKKIDIEHLPGGQFADLEVMRGDAGHLAKRMQPVFQSYQQFIKVEQNVDIKGDVVQGSQTKIEGDEVKGDKVEKKTDMSTSNGDVVQQKVEVHVHMPESQQPAAPVQPPLNYVAIRGLTMDLMYKAEELFPSDRFDDIRKEVVGFLKVERIEDVHPEVLRRKADDARAFLTEVYDDKKTDKELRKNVKEFREKELPKIYQVLPPEVSEDDE